MPQITSLICLDTAERQILKASTDGKALEAVVSTVRQHLRVGRDVVADLLKRPTLEPATVEHAREELIVRRDRLRALPGDRASDLATAVDAAIAVLDDTLAALSELRPDEAPQSAATQSSVTSNPAYV